MSNISIQLDKDYRAEPNIVGDSVFMGCQRHAIVGLHHSKHLELGRWKTLGKGGNRFQYRTIRAYSEDGQYAALTLYRDVPKRKPRGPK